MSPQDEREAIARLAYSWSPSIHEAKTADCEPGGFVEASWEEVSDEVRGWFYDRADAILALRQPGAEYRRGVEAGGVTIDSDVYKRSFYGILNAQGEFWTPLAYSSKHEADNALDRFIGADEARLGSMRSTHRIVPIRIQLTALLPESTKVEGR